MKATIRNLSMAAILLCFGIAPAFAQRSHAGGAGVGSSGGAHGPAMASSGGDHGSAATNAKGAAASSPTTLLTTNTKLDSTLTSKLQSKGLLPAGTDLKDACDGFKNLGQCVAAIHVSHNLNLPFACLKSDMTGTAPATGTTCPDGTGSSKVSLGKSIQTLAPNADVKTEQKTAKRASDTDLKEAESESH
jgi:hypothetical protein